MSRKKGWKNDIAKMLAWLVVNQPEKAKEILTGEAFGKFPSLRGSGKMSKSKEGSYILLTDNLKIIKERVAKIPSLEENYHVFVTLAWFTFSKTERDEVANSATRKILE